MRRHHFALALLAATTIAMGQPPLARSAAPKVHLDRTNEFQLTVPSGWGDAPKVGRIVWHSAAQGGTALPDCSVIVTQDASFALLTVDQFIASQSREQALQLLSISFKNPRIVLWEPNFRLGGQRALHYIYSGELDGAQQASMVLQTTHAGRLYTFSCNAPADQFPLLYTDLLHVADSFAFVPSKTPAKR